jgi:2-amino-4-hydroxy-6-hydroxymethyldihydropteridine diphosphokinase
MARVAWTPAYVGLGGNLGDPAAELRAAFEALGRIPGTRLEAKSSLYRNPPHGPPDQPDYVNAAAALLTTRRPDELLAELQSIEAARGRRRGGPRWGPRTLDLDLLLFGQQRLDGDQLTLPHPGLAERPFVLVPLCEVAPGLRLPDGRLVASLAAAFDRAGLQRLPD